MTIRALFRELPATTPVTFAALLRLVKNWRRKIISGSELVAYKRQRRKEAMIAERFA